MADHDKPESGDLQHKPMKGKYDGRKNNGATKARSRTFSNLGRTPNWTKHLSRNDAAKTLDEFDRIASPADIYRAAWEKGNFGLCAEMYKQFQDRHVGRPFIAEHPAKAAGTQLHDERLQRAIRELLPQAADKTVM